MNDDLSDEAANAYFYQQYQKVSLTGLTFWAGWEECRRRAEQRERKAFEAGAVAALREEGYPIRGLSDDFLNNRWRAYKEQRRCKN